jgi:hypothetical protein
VKPLSEIADQSRISPNPKLASKYSLILTFCLVRANILALETAQSREAVVEIQEAFATMRVQIAKVLAKVLVQSSEVLQERVSANQGSAVAQSNDGFYLRDSDDAPHVVKYAAHYHKPVADQPWLSSEEW